MTNASDDLVERRYYSSTLDELYALRSVIPKLRAQLAAAEAEEVVICERLHAAIGRAVAAEAQLEIARKALEDFEQRPQRPHPRFRPAPLETIVEDTSRRSSVYRPGRGDTWLPPKMHGPGPED